MAKRWAQELVFIGAIFLIGLLPLKDLENRGMFVAHDSIDHVERIANFILALRDGVIVPRWGANLNWGYGHPVLQFLYPLPSYMAAGFYFLGVPLVESVKLTFGVAYISSLLSMYLFLRVMWGRWAGVMGAVVYGFSPYRFVDLYVRGAIGEHVAFMVAPLVFMFIWLISNEKYRREIFWWRAGLSVSIAGLILAHNAVSLMVLGMTIIWGGAMVFNVKDKKQFFLDVTVGVAFGFGITTFYWIPAFFEGKYTLRDIVTRGDIGERFVPAGWFINSSWNYGGGNQFTKEIGLTILIGIVMSWYWVKHGYDKRDKHIWGALMIILMGSLFLMTNISGGIWESISILQKFQFPWRFLTLVILSGAIITAQAVKQINLRQQKIAAVAMMLLTVFGSQQMWRAKEYKNYQESYFWEKYAGTTDTGESSPIWSVRFMEKYSAQPLEPIWGDVQISEVQRSTVRHVYNIESGTLARLVENTLYFPGWKIFVDNKEVPVEFQDPDYRGLMTFEVKIPGTHLIEVVFGDTKLRSAANYISLMAISGGIVSSGVYLWRRKLKYR